MTMEWNSGMVEYWNSGMTRPRSEAHDDLYLFPAPVVLHDTERHEVSSHHDCFHNNLVTVQLIDPVVRRLPWYQSFLNSAIMYSTTTIIIY